MDGSSPARHELAVSGLRRKVVVDEHLLSVLKPSVAMAVALVLAILALGWMQNRRYARPALQLAHFVDHLESDMGAKAPKVPVIWSHWFERVAGAAAERRQLLAKTLEHARELEQKVQERTTT